jgi:cell division septation protein DedD
MEDNKYLYMLNLTRARLFLMGLVIFGLFSLFFFIGLAVGIKSGTTENKTTKTDLTQNQDVAVDVPLSEGLRTNEVSDAKLPFKASPGHLPPLNSTPSAGLLANDKLSSARTKASASQEELAALPDFSARKATKPSSKSSTEKNTPEKSPTEKTTGSGDHYYLQLLATSEKSKAETTSAALLKKNYHAYLKTKQDANGKTIYMVRIGSYEDRQKALRDLNLLREKNGYKDSYMVILKSGKTDNPATGAPTGPAISAL